MKTDEADFFKELVGRYYVSWQSEDKKILKKINELVKDIERSPHKGLGKPEALKYDLADLWSRRIDREHRLVY